MASIPYGRQWVDDDDVAAVVDILRGDFLTTGPAVTAFEKELCVATAASHAVAVNSGTSALHAMYFASGLGPGDEVVTSPLTFAATANAALYLGAKVVFADIDPVTGNLDAEAADQAITDRTKLLVPVDFAGHPADYDRLQGVAEARGVRMVADAAHSLGARYRGRPVGTLADATEVSFHPVKPVTTAEGGAVLTNDPELAKQARLFQTHGITKARDDLRRSNEGGWWYEQHHLGFNYRLTDIQAALGASQMRKLGRFIDRRRQIAARYDDAFADLPIGLPGRYPEAEPGWHLYVIRVHDPSRRRPLFDELRAKGLGVQVHYLPVYWHPYYADLGYREGLCPKAEDFYRRAISLPVFPKMTDDEVARTIDVVRASVLGST